VGHQNVIESRKLPRFMKLEVQVMAWNSHTHMAELNRLMRCHPYSW